MALQHGQSLTSTKERGSAHVVATLEHLSAFARLQRREEVQHGLHSCRRGGDRVLERRAVVLRSLSVLVGRGLGRMYGVLGEHELRVRLEREPHEVRLA